VRPKFDVPFSQGYGYFTSNIKYPKEQKWKFATLRLKIA